MSAIGKRGRRLRRQFGAVGQFVGAVRRDPRIARDLVDGLFGRGAPAPAVPADLGDHVLPGGLAAYTRTVHGHKSIPVPSDVVVAFLSDPSRIPEWLTFHSSWRGEPPTALYEGQSFTEQVMFMGIPADVVWTVTESADASYALHGAGPMGVELGFWLTCRPTGSSTTVYIDAGLSGQPVEGPMGATLMRSLNETLTESLAALPAAIAAAGTSLGAGRARRKPILHKASGKTLAPTTPVIVGVGQVVKREADGRYLDPATLAANALRKAAVDSGAGESLLRSAGGVYAVASASWQYRDMAAIVAAAVGAEPSETVQSSTFGGDGSQLLLNEAAQAISDGRHDVVLVTGAESGATMAAAQRAGVTPEWPEQGPEVVPDRVVGIDKTANNDAELAVGLGAPIYMYSLIESAIRHRLGRAAKEHSLAIAELWSRFSGIAARNENA